MSSVPDWEADAAKAWERHKKTCIISHPLVDFHVFRAGYAAGQREAEKVKD